jgi:predicted nucleic acid-binding protein
MTKYWEKGIMKKPAKPKKKKTFKFICIKEHVNIERSIMKLYEVGEIKSFSKEPDPKNWSLLNMDQPMEVNTPEVYY